MSAAEYQFTPHDREMVKAWTGSHVIGDPASVRRQLEDLVARTDADELMITTNAHGHTDRIESYRLLADAWGLTARALNAAVDA
jgi:alkanesulfonate monooxygenase SsuD/methylene tetrahydromethanopterin reductase-like flavin-dependent oxidoreductase (luciferase family)